MNTCIIDCVLTFFTMSSDVFFGLNKVDMFDPCRSERSCAYFLLKYSFSNLQVTNLQVLAGWLNRQTDRQAQTDGRTDRRLGRHGIFHLLDLKGKPLVLSPFMFSILYQQVIVAYFAEPLYQSNERQSGARIGVATYLAESLQSPAKSYMG